MKTRQISRLTSLIIVLSILAVVGCNQRPGGLGQIPVNEDSVRGHIIPVDQARTYTKTYRDTRDTLYNRYPALKNALNLGEAEAFNKDAIAILLNQKDASGNIAAGIRVYYGLDNNGLVRMVLVPYDSKGNDIINHLITEKAAISIPGISSARAEGSDGQAIENGQRCPVVCAGSGGLGGF